VKKWRGGEPGQVNFSNLCKEKNKKLVFAKKEQKLVLLLNSSWAILFIRSCVEICGFVLTLSNCWYFFKLCIMDYENNEVSIYLRAWRSYSFVSVPSCNGHKIKVLLELGHKKIEGRTKRHSTWSGGHLDMDVDYNKEKRSHETVIQLSWK